MENKDEMVRLHLVECIETMMFSYKYQLQDDFIPEFKEIFERESVLEALGINTDKEKAEEYFTRLDESCKLLKMSDSIYVIDDTIEATITTLLNYYNYQYILKIVDSFGSQSIISLVILNVKRG